MNSISGIDAKIIFLHRARLAEKSKTSAQTHFEHKDAVTSRPSPQLLGSKHR
ncbi:MAG: hypothetical protein ACR2PU_05105 [Gammaproteobacteria bacterium]